MATRWAIIRPDEDGRHFRPKTEASLKHLLQHPDQYGIARFAALDELDSDPALWPEGVAVVLRFEVVMPEPMSGFVLPEDVQ